MSGNQRLQTQITSAMTHHGWWLRKVCELPPCFAKDGIVAPYFWLSGVIDRGAGEYKISGCLGIIHEGFERSWMARYPGHESKHAFAFTSLLVNFPELLKVCYITRQGPHDREIEVFCSSLIALLTALPATEDQLATVFSKDEVLGKPVSRFRNYLQIGKFNGLADFARQGFQGQLP